MLVFLINSRIPPFIQNNPALRACQVPILQAFYPFLEHDSYLNCTKVFDEIDIDQALDHLVNDQDSYKGDLLKGEILEILQAINLAPTITDCDKELIMASLGE